MDIYTELYKRLLNDREIQIVFMVERGYDYQKIADTVGCRMSTAIRVYKEAMKKVEDAMRDSDRLKEILGE